MKTTRMDNASECSLCGKKLNAASSYEDKKPSPGDISVCIQCGELHKFDDSLNTVPLDEGELEKLKQDKALWDSIEFVQKAISSRPIEID